MIPTQEDKLEHAVAEVDDDEEEGIDIDAMDLPDVEIGARRPQIVASEFEHMFDPEDGSLDGCLGIGSEDSRHTLGILPISARWKVHKSYLIRFYFIGFPGQIRKFDNQIHFNFIQIRRILSCRENYNSN